MTEYKKYEPIDIEHFIKVQNSVRNTLQQLDTKKNINTKKNKKVYWKGNKTDFIDYLIKLFEPDSKKNILDREFRNFNDCLKKYFKLYKFRPTWDIKKAYTLYKKIKNKSIVNKK